MKAKNSAASTPRQWCTASQPVIPLCHDKQTSRRRARPGLPFDKCLDTVDGYMNIEDRKRKRLTSRTFSHAEIAGLLLDVVQDSLILVAHPGTSTAEGEGGSPPTPLATSTLPLPKPQHHRQPSITSSQPHKPDLYDPSHENANSNSIYLQLRWPLLKYVPIHVIPPAELGTCRTDVDPPLGRVYRHICANILATDKR